jgi:exodeoxyribonuclease-1
VEELGNDAENLRFEDDRLPEMLFRYRARNYPATLNGEEMERWEEFRSQRLMQPKKGWRSFEAYGLELQKLAQEHADNPTKIQILEDLHLYGEALMPYV